MVNVCVLPSTVLVIKRMSDRLGDASPRGSRSTRKHSEAIATHPVSQNTLMKKLTPLAP